VEFQYTTSFTNSNRMIVLQSTLLTHGTDSPDERCAAGLTAGKETETYP